MEYKGANIRGSGLLDSDRHLWTLSKGGPQSLGLSCDADGLFLGPVALLQRRTSGGFVLRPQPELERILARGFGIGVPVQLDRLMPGLSVVASALNANDLCRARIAAVQLRVPDLPDAFARLDMQLEDVQLKLDRIGKTAAAGDWDPAEHPRTGTPPNPGWFAPTDGGGESAGAIRPTLVSDHPGSDGRLHLPPGDRNDEIGDLLEWIANAKPEDVAGINSEIDRLFYQVGDFQDGNALHHALATVLANPDEATRQQVLNDYEPITHRDNPGAGADLITDLATGALFGPALRPGEAAAGAADAATEEGTAASEEAASDVWKLGWAARGRQIEDALTADAPETRLPPHFPVIDQWADGVATSIKSIDLNAATYQDAGRLAYRISKLADFDGAAYGETVEVLGENIKTRVLNLAVPKGSVTSAQRSAIDAAIARAKEAGVTLKITPY